MPKIIAVLLSCCPAATHCFDHCMKGVEVELLQSVGEKRKRIVGTIYSVWESRSTNCRFNNSISCCSFWDSAAEALMSASGTVSRWGSACRTLASSSALETASRASSVRSSRASFSSAWTCLRRSWVWCSCSFCSIACCACQYGDRNLTKCQYAQHPLLRLAGVLPSALAVNAPYALAAPGKHAQAYALPHARLGVPFVLPSARRGAY